MVKMTGQEQDIHLGEMAGYWNGVVDISRTPSPATRPAKRARTTRQGSTAGTTDSFGQSWIEDGIIDDSLLEMLEGDIGSGFAFDLDEYAPASPSGYAGLSGSFQDGFPPNGSFVRSGRRTKMQTGCIPCLIKGMRCDPRNPGCKRAMSDEWNLNYEDPDDNEMALAYATPESMSLSAYRPDMQWRRSWRERHSLNFFVNFSAPQMAGFFDSTFWQRMVIQTSYYEPAILHAITAIGALHEAIMQRAFADDKRKGQAMAFALSQCNRAIACLTGAQRQPGTRTITDTRLALTTCVLFTCFEAMQGRCDSAVNHALQGRRLLQAAGNPGALGMSAFEKDEIDQMRPLVERLEVQATALLDKGKRPETDTLDRTMPLPPIDFVFSLDHAHNTLHTALNSIMRFMQGFHPTAPKEIIAVTMAEKYLRYAPWFQHWETAFTTYLADSRAWMSNMDLKRAMVLKANHLVGTMLASVDQSAGPVAYDPYETEFRAIVDLSREVLATFSCPPLPTLNGGITGTPYLSFSLWVTDPLWMAISRCRNPSIRQAAFTLLSHNPRQEGIWHAGPQLSNNRYMRRAEAAPSKNSHSKVTVKGNKPLQNGVPKPAPVTSVENNGDKVDGNNGHDRVTAEVQEAQPAGHMRVRGLWVDSKSQIDQWTKSNGERHYEQEKVRSSQRESHTTGRGSMPTIDALHADKTESNDLPWRPQ